MPMCKQGGVGDLKRKVDDYLNRPKKRTFRGNKHSRKTDIENDAELIQQDIDLEDLFEG